MTNAVFEPKMIEAGICRLSAAERSLLPNSCVDSELLPGSSHSGATNQPIASSGNENNNKNNQNDTSNINRNASNSNSLQGDQKKAVPTAAPPQTAATAAGAAGSKQPASPESVNAGQPAPVVAPTAAAQTSCAQPNQDPDALTTPSQPGGAVLTPAAAGAACTPAAGAPAQPRSSLPPAEAEQSAGGAAYQQDDHHQQQQQQQLMMMLEPLPPPDDSDSPQAHAEYQLYLQRWRTGSTLRQRWHRLRTKGLLGNIQAEWDDWQHDLLLDTIQQQLSVPGSIAAAAAARQRRGRAEMESAAAAAAAGHQEPRRVRTRRAPASFQDFHVEGAPPASLGSPDRADYNHLTGAAADAQRRGIMAMQQRLMPSSAGGWDAAALNSNRQLYSYQQQQQQQQHLQPPPPRPRQSNLSREQQPQRRPLNGRQQQQQQADPVSEEFMAKFQHTIQMVLSSGNAQGMEGAAALLADPQALRAFVGTLSQVTDNPAAVMHRVAATLAGQNVQQ